MSVRRVSRRWEAQVGLPGVAPSHHGAGGGADATHMGSNTGQFTAAGTSLDQIQQRGSDGPALATQIKAADQRFVSAAVPTLQIIEQPPAAAHHHQQAAARVEILGVGL